jgi:hypothetical protein
MTITFKLTNCTINTPWLNTIVIHSPSQLQSLSYAHPPLKKGQLTHIMNIFIQLSANADIPFHIPFRFSVTASDSSEWASMTLIKTHSTPHENVLFIHHTPRPDTALRFSKNAFSQFKEISIDHKTPPHIELATSHYIYHGGLSDPLRLTECLLQKTTHSSILTEEFVLANDVHEEIIYSPLFHLIPDSMSTYFKHLINDYITRHPQGLLSPCEVFKKNYLTTREIHQLLGLYHSCKKTLRSPLDSVAFNISGYATTHMTPVMILLNHLEPQTENSCEIQFILHLESNLHLKYSLIIKDDKIDFLFYLK